MLRFAAAGCVLAATVWAQQTPKPVDVGATPNYQFQKPLLNGRGVTSLADLRGKPVMVEFWGTR